MSQIILLSIKPEFAQKILNGSKLYELRRVIPKAQISRVVMYSSSPVCQIVGEFSVEEILKEPVQKLWRLTKEYSGISREKYFRYFAGKGIGYAIKVGKVMKYDEGLSLSHFGVERPPQSFQYLKNYYQK